MNTVPQVQGRPPTKDEREVFGDDCWIDPITGQPVEQGFGSALKQTPQHLAAKAIAEQKAHVISAADFERVAGVPPTPALSVAEQIADLKAKLGALTAVAANANGVTMSSPTLTIPQTPAEPGKVDRAAEIAKLKALDAAQAGEQF